MAADKALVGQRLEVGFALLCQWHRAVQLGKHFSGGGELGVAAGSFGIKLGALGADVGPFGSQQRPRLAIGGGAELR